MPLATVAESFLEAHGDNFTKFFRRLWQQRHDLPVIPEDGVEGCDVHDWLVPEATVYFFSLLQDCATRSPR